MIRRFRFSFQVSSLHTIQGILAQPKVALNRKQAGAHLSTLTLLSGMVVTELT